MDLISKNPPPKGASLFPGLECSVRRQIRRPLESRRTADGLRNRSPEHKAAIIAEVERHIWPAIEAGKVKPVVYKMLPLSEAAEAHRIIERSISFGKIIPVP